jgi:hypothetical protein
MADEKQGAQTVRMVKCAKLGKEPPAVEGRNRQAHLRKHLERSVGNVGEPLEDVAE